MMLKFLIKKLQQLFRQLVKAADPVGRQRDVDLVGVGQVEVVHDVDELFLGLGQARI